MLAYNSSLRCRTIEDTWDIGKEYAKKYGITRVTNITRLDNIGVPVYSAIRPDAQRGSLCVTAGKGTTDHEAKVGALMEGIEMAIAEPSQQKLNIISSIFSEVLDSNTRPEAVLDFCPKIHSAITLDQKVDCVWATDLINPKKQLIPAELIYLPYQPGATKYFGYSSNGLASGNSLTEASIHGILELIERDITSFQTIHLNVSKVDPDSLPPNAMDIYQKVISAGHEMVIWYSHNSFGIPHFMSIILDGRTDNPLYINMGFGCHSLKNIALIRSMTEVVQGRLSYIHGGRDDLYLDFDKMEHHSEKSKFKWFQKLVDSVRSISAQNEVRYQILEELEFKFTDLEEYLDELLLFLQNQGFNYVLQVPFTLKEEPIQVVKMVIPKMEFFSEQSPRIGPRLLSYATKAANGHLHRS
jgi:ribosomal protein S12 methylthiotransferase accessory factor